MSSLSHPGHAGDAQPPAIVAGTWLRNTRRTHAWATISAAWALIFAGLLLIPGRVPAGGLTAGTAIVVALYCAVAAIGVVLAIRVARAGVWIGASGVVIRGPLRTQLVPLADAGRFEPGLQGRGGNGVPCPMLARRGRPAVGIWALGQRNIWFRYARVCEELTPMCGELNAVVGALSSELGAAPATARG
jgi:hypothetical protein